MFKIFIDHLQNSGLVIIPTETVYGLAADATNPAAVAKIYQIKERPANNPLIIHVKDIKMAEEFAIFNDLSLEIAHKFWPGPLTLVLKLRKDSGIAFNSNNGMDTIAIRVPCNQLTLGLLQEFGKPLAAPSANYFTKLSPTSCDALEIKHPDVLILKDQKCQIGLESTILDISGHRPTILRYGSITAEDIGIEVDFKLHSGKAPGGYQKHYSPQKPIRINAEKIENNQEALLGFGPMPCTMNLSVVADLNEAAHNLYSMLRLLDKDEKYNRIAVVPIPKIGIGIAINDRLGRM